MAKKRSSGEGSIWKEGNSWRAAITLDRKRVTRSFKTQKQALDWIHQVKHQVNQGLTYSATHIMLENFLSEWLNIHKTVLKPEVCRAICPARSRLRLSKDREFKTEGSAG